MQHNIQPVKVGSFHVCKAVVETYCCSHIADLKVWTYVVDGERISSCSC